MGPRDPGIPHPGLGRKHRHTHPRNPGRGPRPWKLGQRFPGKLGQPPSTLPAAADPYPALPQAQTHTKTAGSVWQETPAWGSN